MKVVREKMDGTFDDSINVRDLHPRTKEDLAAWYQHQLTHHDEETLSALPGATRVRIMSAMRKRVQNASPKKDIPVESQIENLRRELIELLLIRRDCRQSLLPMPPPPLLLPQHETG